MCFRGILLTGSKYSLISYFLIPGPSLSLYVLVHEAKWSSLLFILLSLGISIATGKDVEGIFIFHLQPAADQNISLWNQTLI